MNVVLQRRGSARGRAVRACRRRAPPRATAHRAPPAASLQRLLVAAGVRDVRSLRPREPSELALPRALQLGAETRSGAAWLPQGPSGLHCSVILR